MYHLSYSVTSIIRKYSIKSIKSIKSISYKVYYIKSITLV